MQQAYAKSEASLRRALKIYKTTYGKDSLEVAVPLTSLCYVYDLSQKPEKSAACHGDLVSLGEKLFGPDSPNLARDLLAQAQALRKLGRNDEAEALERRLQSLQSAAAQVSAN